MLNRPRFEKHRIEHLRLAIGGSPKNPFDNSADVDECRIAPGCTTGDDAER